MMGLNELGAQMERIYTALLENFDCPRLRCRIAFAAFRECIATLMSSTSTRSVRDR